MDLPVRLDGKKMLWRGFVIDRSSVAFIPQEGVEWGLWSVNGPREWRGWQYSLVPPDINDSLDHEWLKGETLEMIIPVTGRWDLPLRFKWSLDGANEAISEICPDDD